MRIQFKTRRSYQDEKNNKLIFYLNFPFYIAKRYLFAKSGNNAINIISRIASVGVVVGTVALFIILSGFSGLRTFNDSLLNISDPDIKITASKGKSFYYDHVLKKLLNHNDDIDIFSKVIEERVVIKYGEKQQISYVKGVDYNYTQVVKLEDAIHIGTWIQKEYTNTSVIGNRLAYKLSVGVGSFEEPLEIIVPKKGALFLNPMQSFRSIKTQIIGAYFGTEDFENNYVFVSNIQAQQLLNYDQNQFTALNTCILRKFRCKKDYRYKQCQWHESIGIINDEIFIVLINNLAHSQIGMRQKFIDILRNINSDGYRDQNK